MSVLNLHFLGVATLELLWVNSNSVNTSALGYNLTDELIWLTKCGKQNSTRTNSTKKEICVLFFPCAENLVLNPSSIPSAPTKCSVSGSDSCQNHFLSRHFSFSLYYWQEYITASSEYSSNTNSCASWRIRHVKIAVHWISWLFLYGNSQMIAETWNIYARGHFFAEQGKRERGNAHPQKRRNKVLTKRRRTRNKPVVVVFLESSVALWTKSKILMLHLAL